MTDYSAHVSQINQARSLEEIREIARGYSAQAAGDGGVLYSGRVGNVKSEAIALEIAERAGVPIINNTPRAAFLSDNGVKQAIERSANRLFRAEGYAVDAAESMAMNFQYGDPKAVSNSLTSLDGCLWGDASREFAASLRGDIKVIATAANMERVFGKVELPTVLDNPNVQTLGGRSIAELRSIASREGTQALLSAVQAQFVDAAPRGIYKLPSALSIPAEPVTLSRELADTIRVDSSRFSPAANLSTSGTLVRADIGMAAQVARDEVSLMRTSMLREHVQAQNLRSPGAAIPDAGFGLAAADSAAARPSGNPGLKAAGIAGTALLAHDFATSGHKWVQLHSQGNQAGADSTAAHFVGRNVGGAMGGFIAGAGVGALTGSWTGPGALAVGLGGGVMGAYMGERWAAQKDIDRIYTQEDPLGRVWTRQPGDADGRWLRGAHQQQVQTTALGGQVEVRPVQTALGEDAYFREQYVATGRLERLLNHQAANASYGLGLANPPPPKDPYRLDASAQTQPPRAPFEQQRDFVRDAQSGQWQLEIRQLLDGRTPSTQKHPVDAERAQELDQQARTVIAQNAANTPAAMASRYQVAYEQGRWSDFAPELPAAIRDAQGKANTLQASDGNTYTRAAEGQWVSRGVVLDSTATHNLRDELNLTWQSQQAGVREMQMLAEHVRANPQVEPEGVRGQLDALYAKHGIERSAAQLEAATATVERNHARDGLQQDFTLALMPDPRTHAPSADSAIASFSADGGNRMLLKSTTTAQEIAQQQAPRTPAGEENPLPETPERRIDALSPQEREAHQQALHEANRQGVSTQEAQQVASFAAAHVHAPHAEANRAPDAAIEVERPRGPAPHSAVPAAASAAAAVAVPMAPTPAVPERPVQAPPTAEREVPRPAAEARPAPADDAARQGMPAGATVPAAAMPSALPSAQREVPTAPLAGPAPGTSPAAELLAAAALPRTAADATQPAAPQAHATAARTPMQPGHPDHALYQQVRDGVAALDARHGRSFDETSERMTASLLVLAKGSGLERVDHVLLSNTTPQLPAAHNIFVVQGEPNNPAHQRALMPTEQAATTPVDASLQQFEVVSAEQQQRQQSQQLHDAREQQGVQARAASMG